MALAAAETGSKACMAWVQIALFAPLAATLVEVVALVVVVVVPVVLELEPPQAVRAALSRPKTNRDPARRSRTISSPLPYRHRTIGSSAGGQQ